MRTICSIAIVWLTFFAPSVCLAEYGLTVILPVESVEEANVQLAVTDGVEAAFRAFRDHNDESAPNDVNICTSYIPYGDCRAAQTIMERASDETNGVTAILNAAAPHCLHTSGEVISVNLLPLEHEEIGRDPLFIHNSVPFHPELRERFVAESFGSRELMSMDDNPEGLEVFLHHFMNQTDGADQIPLASFAAYDATLVLLHAISRAGPNADRGQVRDSFSDILNDLANGDFNGEPQFVLNGGRDCSSPPPVCNDRP